MKKIIKNITAYTLTMVLAVTTFAFSGGVKTVEAASKSVDVVAAEENNSGDTIKYSYNKKGLVSKMVSKNSQKDNDSDVSETITTTYKYNKKNKVAKKTTKSVTKTKSYEMDKTTGMKIVGTRGTVTDTTTTVTTYKYNKKGLATLSVATTTYGKSGTLKDTDKSTIVENEVDAAELSDGRVIAGYNSRKPDGTYYSDKEKAQAAYYYSGSIALTEGTTVTTTSYKNKGKGKYTRTTTTTRNDSGYKTEPVTTYYGTDSNGSYVALTKGDFTDADGEHYDYQRPDGTYTNSCNFSRIEQIKITQDLTAASNRTTVRTDEYSSKSITTTKYSYDKKKRVKKEVATTVDKDSRAGSQSYSSSSASQDSSSYGTTSYSRKSDSTSKDEYTGENTSVTTTTYTYDKKGRAKKQVFKNDGKGNSKEVEASMTVSENSEKSQTTTYNNGQAPRTETSTSSSSYSAYPTTTTTTVVKGVQTTTVTSNPYTVTYKDAFSDNSYSRSTTGTRDYVTYANGGRKTTDTYTTSYNDNTPGGSYTKAGTEISYRFDETGNSTGSVDTYKQTYNDGTINEITNAEYQDAAGYVSDDTLATQKIDAAKAALEASGTPFNKITTKTALAAPSKATTTYSYDKKGNVKVANTKGTYTSIVDVQNETYGNTICEFDASGELRAKQRAVTHKYTNKGTRENTVKDGTNSLTKVLLMNKPTRDRSKGKGYGLTGRVTYKIKKKKSSVATLAKKQQWILQNGRLNGIVGLD